MADILTYDSDYLNKNRLRIKEDVAYARYKVDDTWYRTEIDKAAILSDGRIEVIFTIDHTVSGNITVSEIELYDKDGDRIGNRTVSITRQDAVEGILYVCRLSLFQVVPNTGGTGAYDAL